MLKHTIALGLFFSLTAMLIFCMHFFLVKIPAEQSKNQHAYDQAASAPENLLLICPPSHDGKPILPNQCKKSGQYEHDRRQQMLDHEAQVSMKKAAWSTVLLTFTGLILIGFTLVQAFKAARLADEMLREAQTATKVANEGLLQAAETAKAAVVSAKESRKATAVTRYSAMADLQPYIQVSDIKITRYDNYVTIDRDWGPETFLQDSGLYFDITLENIGKTPAYNVSMHSVFIGTGNAELKGPNSFFPSARAVVLNPNYPQTIRMKFFPEFSSGSDLLAHFKGVAGKNGLSMIHIQSHITFEDVFSNNNEMNDVGVVREMRKRVYAIDHWEAFSVDGENSIPVQGFSELTPRQAMRIREDKGLETPIF